MDNEIYEQTLATARRELEILKSEEDELVDRLVQIKKRRAVVTAAMHTIALEQLNDSQIR